MKLSPSAALTALLLTLPGCSESPVGPENPFSGPPALDSLDPALAPTPPENLNLSAFCITGPQNGAPAGPCPVLRWGGYTYWPYTDGSNASTMTVIAFDEEGELQKTWFRAGARYPWKMVIDEVAETVTIWGQADHQIVLSWDELRL